MNKKLKVLILEDIKTDAELIKFYLEDSEFDCDFALAMNKREFRTLFKTYNPDIVLSDYTLPDYTGLEALEFVRENAPEMPFILVTGTLGEEKAVETILAGANDFLLKQNLYNLPAAILRSLNVTREQKAHKEALIALEESEKYFKALIENSHDFIAVADQDNVVSYASPALNMHLGYSNEDIIGQKLTKLIHPNDIGDRNEQISKILNGKTKKVKIRKRWITKDGAIRWMESVVSDQRDTPGVWGLVSNIRDIHDQVMAERQLLEKHILLNSVMDNLSEGVVVADNQGEVLLMNKATQNLGGNDLDPADLLKVEMLFKSNTKTRYKIDELPLIRATRGEMVDNEVMYIRSNNSQGLHINANARPLKSDSGEIQGGVVSFSDITEKVHYQTELEKTLQELEERVEKRTAELVNTHKQLEEAHKHITYSINYAKRIQQAIIPSAEQMRVQFPNSFKLFMPKDIVSGDFIWMYGEKLIHLAVVDCTGHGVPGALMSMIGNESLNRIVVDRRIHRPEIILEELDKLVADLLKRGTGNEGMNDGMDLSLCSIDVERQVISFAAAGNIGLLVQNGEAIILEANRHAIGGYMAGKVKEFNRTLKEYEKGDRLYFFTDGFQDQFGGENGKKFTKKRLINLIMDLQKKPMHDQYEIIQSQFDNWKGKEMQIDDVTLVGVEL